ncbi:hypothetical protein B0H17DRAFT_1199272 [Mycena rosella]|uniref:Uncharacterized protein n=1 Tax=Mycena rosella TaxID=1033263 RepID=A0AAD7GMA0_MYCRO|nr:hypothetical protein B0H17DRAFT_1199272 [Mycena rosella]
MTQQGLRIALIVPFPVGTDLLAVPGTFSIPSPRVVASPSTLHTKSITDAALVWLTQHPPFRCAVTHGFSIDFERL